MNTAHNNENNDSENISKKSPLLSMIEIIENNSTISESLSSEEKKEYMNNIQNILAGNKVNILIAGATGSGKSTTVNALFNTDDAGIGNGPDPETKEVLMYSFRNMTIWDTPGFGDSPEQDRATGRMIKDLLERNNEKGLPLIDLVLLILDGSSRDMMSTFEIITSVIEPYVRYRDSIIVAINQTDIAMKGRYWNRDERKPEPRLISFMNDKVVSVEERIRISCGLEVKAMYYSALEKYNILKLLCFIIDNLPDEEKIINVAEQVNRNPEIWMSHDEETQELSRNVFDKLSKVVSGAVTGAAIGSKISTKIGLPPLVGSVVGGIIGGIVSLFGF